MYGYGLPETPTIDDSEGGRLVASISITREPRGCEPFIAISYEVSLRVFSIAFALAKMDGSLNKSILQKAQDQNNRNSNQSSSNNNNTEKYEDYSVVTKERAAGTDNRSEDTDKNDKSLAGKKKRKD